MVDFGKALRERREQEEQKKEQRSIPKLAPEYGVPLSFFRYIAGSAGTGKTWEAREEARANPSARLTATTGIAAVNLGDASTIHAALGFFSTESAIELYTEELLDGRFISHAKLGITDWYIDEASMLGGKLFTCLVNSVIAANDKLMTMKSYDGNPITMTLIGDFAQLPPVDDSYAFERDEWVYFEDSTTVLREIRRQTDVDFVRALQAARQGRGREALDYFEPFLEFNKTYDYDGTTLLGVNTKVDRTNALRLQDLPGPYITYDARRWGSQVSGWDKIPDVLKLKEGCLVMVLVNRRDEFGNFICVNGDTGIFLGDEYGLAQVRLDRTEEEIEVHRNTREHKVPEAAPSGKRVWKVEGTIDYMPLRVAYATSVHKAQGLTLDNVQVCFSDWFFKTPGMLYVGLSRVRTPKGLRLVGLKEQFLQRCVVDEKVRRWL